MIRLTLRNLNANKIRLALTTFAIVLGVSFVVSSFVLTDGLRQSFGSLSQEIVGTTDLEVRPVSDFGSPKPLDASVEQLIGNVDGVSNAVGQVVSDNIQPIKADGTPVTTAGPPLFGFSWVDDPALSSFTLMDGRAPVAGLEFTIDETSAIDGGFVIGDSYGMITPTGRAELTLVGITRFGEANDTLGAVLTQFPLETARQLFEVEGQFDTVLVRFDSDADPAAVQASIQALLPAGAETLNRTALVDDVNADFDQGIDIINNALLGFAVVALFVSIFIIANTFAIVFGQRTKELALLRAIGASGSQVRKSTMAESFIVGLVASGLGIAGGLGLAAGLTALFDALGAGLPDSPLTLAPRTVVIALIVGVGVTMASAFGPARRASRIAPIAAIQDSVDAPRQTDRRRTITGAGLMGVGLAVGGAGLFGSIDSTPLLLAALAGGAVLVFLGLTLMAATAARPVISLLGLPLRALGTAGRLSTRNATRNPRRTASTAASLMIGLALVTMALVVGESLKQGISETLESSVRADFVSSSNNPITPSVITELGASSAFDAVAGYRYDEVKILDEVRGVIGSDLEATDKLFDLDVTSGALTNRPDTVAVFADEAIEQGLAVGDQINVEFPTGATDTLTVSAIFASNAIIDEDYLISSEGWTDRFGIAFETWAAALVSEDATTTQALTAIASLQEKYPQVTFESQAELQASIAAEIDQMLVAINALLVLAIVIALIGIANTLALSVFERTRELGLLRAVGMTRRQTRRMIRWEAVQVSLFGSVLGIGAGLVFGWGVVTALPDALLTSLSVPVGRISVLVAVCAFSGLLAAALPARRAARLDVLAAINHA